MICLEGRNPHKRVCLVDVFLYFVFVLCICLCCIFFEISRSGKDYVRGASP